MAVMTTILDIHREWRLKKLYQHVFSSNNTAWNVTIPTAVIVFCQEDRPLTELLVDILGCKDGSEVDDGLDEGDDVEFSLPLGMTVVGLVDGETAVDGKTVGATDNTGLGTKILSDSEGPADSLLGEERSVNVGKSDGVKVGWELTGGSTLPGARLVLGRLVGTLGVLGIVDGINAVGTKSSDRQANKRVHRQTKKVSLVTVLKNKTLHPKFFTTPSS